MKEKYKNIIVSVQPHYLPEQSNPNQQKFIWSYEITIHNQSDEVVQLLSRYWRITDMTGKVDEVEGLGVIGMQPIIKSGKEFVYSSYCQLDKPQGTMEGHYEMQDLHDGYFSVSIPKFILSAPAVITQGYRSLLH